MRTVTREQAITRVAQASPWLSDLRLFQRVRLIREFGIGIEIHINEGRRALGET